MSVFTSGNYGYTYYANAAVDPYQQQYEDQVAKERLSALKEEVAEAKKSSGAHESGDDSMGVFADVGVPSAAGSYRDPISYTA